MIDFFIIFFLVVQYLEEISLVCPIKEFKLAKTIGIKHLHVLSIFLFLL